MLSILLNNAGLSQNPSLEFQPCLISLSSALLPLTSLFCNRHLFFTLSRRDLVVRLAVMFILHEKVLVDAVSGESDGRSAQTGQGALESVPSGEGTSVSPCLPTK